jgi:hypothetical protein
MACTLPTQDIDKFGYNPAVQCFGEEVMIEALFQFSSYYNHQFPIISVGSGAGKIEFKTQSLHPTIQFVCVDPNPLSFKTIDSKIYIKPHYVSVRQMLIKKKWKDVKGKCLLLLNWCEPGSSTYDFEAVSLLCPVAMFCTTEILQLNTTIPPMCGASGGKLFFDTYIRDHFWIPNDHHKKSKSVSGFKLLHSIHLIPHSTAENKTYRHHLVWLEKDEGVESASSTQTTINLPFGSRCQLPYKECSITAFLEKFYAMSALTQGDIEQ